MVNLLTFMSITDGGVTTHVVEPNCFETEMLNNSLDSQKAKRLLGNSILQQKAGVQERWKNKEIHEEQSLRLGRIVLRIFLCFSINVLKKICFC